MSDISDELAEINSFSEPKDPMNELSRIIQRLYFASDPICASIANDLSEWRSEYLEGVFDE